MQIEEDGDITPDEVQKRCDERRRRALELREALEEAHGTSFDLKYPIAQIHLWYQSFQNVMRWIGTIAAGMLTFTVSILMGDALAGNIRFEAVEHNLGRFTWSFGFLGLSMISVLLTLVITYNWLVMSIRHAAWVAHPSVRRLQAVIDNGGALPRDLPESLQEGHVHDDDPYMDGTMASEFVRYGGKLHLKLWGTMSYVMGGIAGASLFIGIVFYVLAAWDILAELL
ncbi:hypothetical protein HFP89_05795 [Wenzhouxiangella sp. XN79A]|uniref:hypothetical protein n=1 Tax=Wenzhouxiangella sp. XN79A TaxID=2724193 RepID=UPI00144AF1B7|nr:hypothetical protein [Wenzhouxiangella sp. XN79A]NKI34673.1 hypothetical protein [Wenzhouxiangella sp. XN79A]